MFRYFPIKTVSLYLIKEFLKIFALIIFSISILVFIVDFMEFFPNIQKFSIPPVDAIKIVVFRIPNMLESFLQFLILLTTIFTVIKIASRSELTVLYVNGFSTWKILKIYSYLVFVIGLVVIFFLNFLFSVLAKQSKLMENRYSRKENEYFIESNSGIWFRQIDPETNVEFIVRAKKVYVNEVNTLPGFTKYSMFPSLWADEGVEFTELIEKIVEYGYERYRVKDNRKTVYWD